MLEIKCACDLGVVQTFTFRLNVHGDVNPVSITEAEGILLRDALLDRFPKELS